jgi:hypothetical protein
VVVVVVVVVVVGGGGGGGGGSGNGCVRVRCERMCRGCEIKIERRWTAAASP